MIRNRLRSFAWKTTWLGIIVARNYMLLRLCHRASLKVTQNDVCSLLNMYPMQLICMMLHSQRCRRLGSNLSTSTTLRDLLHRLVLRVFMLVVAAKLLQVNTR